MRLSWIGVHFEIVHFDFTLPDSEKTNALNFQLHYLELPYSMASGIGSPDSKICVALPENG